MKNFHGTVWNAGRGDGTCFCIKAETEEEAINLVKKESYYAEGKIIEISNVQEWHD